MVLRNAGSVFEFEDLAFPSNVTVVSGSKLRGSHCWKLCPYSTQSTTEAFDIRIPDIEKTYHQETNGQQYSYSISNLMGWACADNGCSFFLGTATTEVDQQGRLFVPASGTTCDAAGLASLTGTVRHISKGRTIVSRTRYIEI
jgi:hypothetical protein